MEEKTWDRLTNQIIGVMDFFRIIPIKPLSKKPVGTDYYNKDYDIVEMMKHEGNLGVTVGYDAHKSGHKDGFSLSVIDIDGIKIIDENGNVDLELKSKSADYIYEKLIPYFNDSIVVQTQSGGKHIYVLNESEDKITPHVISKSLHFPEDCPIEEIAGKNLGASIEIFSYYGVKQCILPGSRFYDEENDEVREYKVISKQNNIFKMTPIPNVHFKVRESLINENFRYDESLDKTVKKKVEDINKNDETSLSKYNIVETAKFCKEIYDMNYDQKHYLTLPLGGYLANHINKDSIRAVGECIISLCGDGYFKNNEQFLSDFCKSTDVSQDNRAGGYTLYDDFIDHNEYTSQTFFAKMMHCLGKNVEFAPARCERGSFSKIIIDRENNLTNELVCRWDKVKDENGDYDWIEKVSSSRPGIGGIILEIKLIKNPIIKFGYNERVIVKIKNPGGRIISFVGDDMESIIHQARRVPGLVMSNHFNWIINQVFTYFNTNHMIKFAEESSIPGIFIINDKLKRYDIDGSIINIESLDISGLKDAILLLENVVDLLNIEKEVAGHIIRVGLAFAFNYITKNRNMNPKFLILAGTGSAGKTTLAQIATSFYAPFIDRPDKFQYTKFQNGFSGSDFSTPYRAAERLGNSTLGVICDEPGALFVGNESSIEALEVLKKGIESNIARVVYDNTQYSYGSVIFTSNVPIPQSGGFVRRSNIFEFGNENIIRKEDIKNITELLGTSSWHNAFKKFRVIGDFCCKIVNENLEVFDKYNVEEFELWLVEQIEKETSIDLSWMKEVMCDVFDDLSETVEDYMYGPVLRDIIDIYNYHRKEYHKFNPNTGENASDYDNAFRIDVLKKLITENRFEYISLIDDEWCFFVGPNLKKYFKNKRRIGDEIVPSVKRLKEELGEDNKESYYDDRIYINKKRVRGLFVKYELLDDLLNQNF